MAHYLSFHNNLAFAVKDQPGRELCARTGSVCDGLDPTTSGSRLPAFPCTCPAPLLIQRPRIDTRSGLLNRPLDAEWRRAAVPHRRCRADCDLHERPHHELRGRGPLHAAAFKNRGGRRRPVNFIDPSRIRATRDVFPKMNLGRVTLAMATCLRGAAVAKFPPCGRHLPIPWSHLQAAPAHGWEEGVPPSALAGAETSRSMPRHRAPVRRCAAAWTVRAPASSGEDARAAPHVPRTGVRRGHCARCWSARCGG